MWWRCGVLAVTVAEQRDEAVGAAYGEEAGAQPAARRAPGVVADLRSAQQEFARVTGQHVHVGEALDGDPRPGARHRQPGGARTGVRGRRVGQGDSGGGRGAVRLDDPGVQRRP